MTTKGLPRAEVGLVQAVSINGRVFLREYTDEDAKADEEKLKKGAKRK